MDENVVKGFELEEPKIPRFKVQPKIHEEGNPERPIFSLVKCQIIKKAQFISYHLPYVLIKFGYIYANLRKACQLLKLEPKKQCSIKKKTKI